MNAMAQTRNVPSQMPAGGSRRKRLSAEDDVLAGLLAADASTLAELAAAFGVSQSYMRKIACVDKPPRVARLAEQLSQASWRMAIQPVRADSGAAIRALIAVADGTDPAPARVRLRACSNALRIAFITIVVCAAMRRRLTRRVSRATVDTAARHPYSGNPSARAFGVAIRTCGPGSITAVPGSAWDGPEREHVA